MPRNKLSNATTEKLIDLVHRNHILYDSAAPEHKDGEKIFNAWQTIAKIMGTEKMGASEWKKKWRNLRDSYVKKRRQIKTSNSYVAKRAMKWKFLDIMNFLDIHIEESSTERNMSLMEEEGQSENSYQSEDEDDGTGTTNSTKANIMTRHSRGEDEENVLNPVGVLQHHGHLYRPTIIKPEPWPLSEEEEMSTSSSAMPETSNRKRKRDDAFYSLILESTRARQQVEKQMKEQKTAEDIFFESCALRIQKLPATMRSFIQLQISQLFLNAENPQMPQLPITPLPIPQPQVPPALPQPQVPPALSNPQVPPASSNPQVPPALSNPQVPPALPNSQVTPALSEPQETPHFKPAPV